MVLSSMSVEDNTVPPIRRADQRQVAQHRLLKAAVTQLAEAGMRGLTHRKVEQRAGLAQGSAKYYFGTLDALIEAVLGYLADRDLPYVLEFSPADREVATDAAGRAELLGRAQDIADVVLSGREDDRARFQIYLHAAGHPRLQALVAQQRDRFIDRISASLPGPDSDAAARFVCAVIDGILLDQISAPSTVVQQNTARYILAAGVAGAAVANQT